MLHENLICLVESSTQQISQNIDVIIAKLEDNITRTQ